MEVNWTVCSGLRSSPCFHSATDMESPAAGGGLPWALCSLPVTLITTTPNTAPHKKTKTRENMATFSEGGGSAGAESCDAMLESDRLTSLSVGGQRGQHVVAIRAVLVIDRGVVLA